MATFTEGMFHRLQTALGLRAAPPPPTPAQRAEAAAIQRQTAEQRAWMQRLERIQRERQWEQAMREQAERDALAAELERRRQVVEAIKEICARNGGYYFPGDPLPSSDLNCWGQPRARSFRQWLGEVVAALGGRF